MKRYFILLILLTLALVSCSQDLSIQLEVPREKLQQKIEQDFPISTKEQDESIPVDVVISDPEVILEEGNDQLGLRLTVAVTPPELIEGIKLPDLGGAASLALKGQVTIFVSLRYDPEIQAMYISEPKITALDFALLPEPLVDPVSRAIEQVLAVQLAKEPFDLPEDEALLNATKPVLKSIIVKDGKLLLEFGL